MTETNRIIAEFMGAKLGNGTKSDPIVYVNVPDFWSKKTTSTHSVKTLSYHNRWDWLMQVVAKIEALGYSVAINKRNCYIFDSVRGNSKYDVTTMRTTKIEATYAAVVAFINWYNQNKNNENN